MGSMTSDIYKRPRAGACATCRVRKRRCIPASKWDGCRLCQSLSKPCSLRRGPDPPSVITAVPENATHDGRQDKEHGLGVLGSQELFLELVPLYFHYIHNIAHTVFHEPSFMRRLQDGRASMIHVYAMCALAARYSTNEIFSNIPPCARGKPYVTEAIRRCHEHMVSPGLETAQGFLLIGYYFGGEGNIQGKHIYVGIARLHADVLPPEETASVVLREELRRTWLSIYIASHWSASDMAIEPTNPFNGPTPLPRIDDADFHTLGSDLLSESPASPASRYDMWAQMARTLNIFTKINILLRRLSKDEISFDGYCTEAAVLEHNLHQWEKNLPPSLVYTYENFMLLVGKQMGQTFLSMHIGYYHFRLMLLFPFLNTRLAQWNVRDRAGKCKESAAIVSDILQHAKTVPNCEMDYFIYGHIAVVSSSVHLHTLLTSNEQSELGLARQRLVFNFQYLMSLKSYWPVVDHFVTDLRTFQNSCRDSMSDPFILDNWMARFLTEHSSALSERQMTVVQLPSYDAGTPPLRPIGPSDEIMPADSLNPQVLGAAGSKAVGTKDHTEARMEDNDLSRLLEDQGMSGEAIVNSALNWLLDDNYGLE